MQPALRPRLAWFSILNIEGKETPSPSAYFSDELLPLLKRRFEIELFHNGFDKYQGFPTFHYLTAVQRHQKKPYDLFFYQLEDGPASYFTRMHLALLPGVVLFHDFLFTSDGPEPILNSAWEEVIKKFHNPSRGWPARSAEYKKQGPQAYREAAMANVAIFSCEKDHAEYKRLIKTRLNSSADPGSFFLPHPVSGKLAQIASRPKSGEDQWSVGYAGSVRIEHRAHKLLEAVSHFGKKLKLIWLVCEQEREQAQALVNEFGVECFELVCSRTPEKWAALLDELDAACHPLFGVYGQPGPYLAMSLMAGLPCLVTGFGAIDYYPEQIVFKITPGESEATEMEQALGAILRRQVQFDPRAISAYAYELHESSAVAAQLGWILEQSRGQLRLAQLEWQAFETLAQRALLKEVYSAEIRAEGSEGVLEPAFQDLGWL